MAQTFQQHMQPLVAFQMDVEEELGSTCRLSFDVDWGSDQHIVDVFHRDTGTSLTVRVPRGEDASSVAIEKITSELKAAGVDIVDIYDAPERQLGVGME